MGPFVTYTIVAVTEARSENDLEIVSKTIIGDLPAHNLVLIFYYRDEEEAKAEIDFTVGKAYWGAKSTDKDFERGDYSDHELQISIPKN
jgi:hypothetical protein